MLWQWVLLTSDSSSEAAEQTAELLPRHRDDVLQFERNHSVDSAIAQKSTHAKVKAYVRHTDRNGEQQAEFVWMVKAGTGMSRCAWYATSCRTLATRVYILYIHIVK